MPGYSIEVERAIIFLWFGMPLSQISRLCKLAGEESPLCCDFLSPDPDAKHKDYDGSRNWHRRSKNETKWSRTYPEKKRLITKSLYVCFYGIYTGLKSDPKIFTKSIAGRGLGLKVQAQLYELKGP